MITIQEIADFEAFMNTAGPDENGARLAAVRKDGTDLLRLLCDAARAGVAAESIISQVAAQIERIDRLDDALTRSHAKVERLMARDLAAAIADERAEKLRKEGVSNMIDAVYDERNRCVAAVAKMGIAMGWTCGLGRHENPVRNAEDDDDHDEQVGDWDPAWMNVVYVETPAGQTSWHIHDRDLPMFSYLPAYKAPWDGHSTAEKYARLEAMWPYAKEWGVRPLESDRSARIVLCPTPVFVDDGWPMGQCMLRAGHDGPHDLSERPRHSEPMSGAETARLSQLFGVSAKEPMPAATARRPSWEILLAHVMERLPAAKLLHADMRERDAFGRAKYGVPLTSGNGRNHLVDAYQELLDFAVYITNELDERGYPPRVISIHADGEKSYVGMPEDVFSLHELLRESVFHLSAMRLMIERRRRDA